jgi:hypothetical protein
MPLHALWFYVDDQQVLEILAMHTSAIVRFSLRNIAMRAVREKHMALLAIAKVRIRQEEVKIIESQAEFLWRTNYGTKNGPPIWIAMASPIEGLVSTKEYHDSPRILEDLVRFMHLSPMRDVRAGQCANRAVFGD